MGARRTKRRFALQTLSFDKIPLLKESSSSVRGFAEINESDLMLIPDKSTSRTYIEIQDVDIRVFSL
jgi:glutamine synthetase